MNPLERLKYANSNFAKIRFFLRISTKSLPFFRCAFFRGVRPILAFSPDSARNRRLVRDFVSSVDKILAKLVAGCENITIFAN